MLPFMYFAFSYSLNPHGSPVRERRRDKCTQLKPLTPGRPATATAGVPNPQGSKHLFL